MKDAGGLWAVLSLVPALGMLAGLPMALLASARAGSGPLRVQEALRAAPLACSIAGLSAGLSVVLLAAGAKSVPSLGIPLLLLAATVATASFVGLVAEARRLGEELGSGSVAAGWLVLSGLPILPLAGTLVWLFLAMRGAGACFVAVARRS